MDFGRILAPFFLDFIMDNYKGDIEFEIFEFKIFLLETGYIHAKDIETQGMCGIQRIGFNWALCCSICDDIFDIPYAYRYCYKDYSEALHDLLHWDGNGYPSGDWIKRKGVTGDLLGVETAHTEALLLGPH